MVIATLSGILLTILLFLGYIAMWTPRVKKNGDYEGYRGGWKTAWLYHPWLVILIYLGIATFEIWFVAHFTVHPPNW